MKIGIISDTHDNVRHLRKAIEHMNQAEVSLVIHCGDWITAFTMAACYDLKAPLETVLGNCDSRLDGYQHKSEHCFKDEMKNIIIHEQFLDTEQGGRRVAAVHGQDTDLLKHIVDSGKYDLVASGHTHQPKIERRGKTLMVNPGSTVGYYGGHEVPVTIALYDTEKNEAEIIELAV